MLTVFSPPTVFTQDVHYYRTYRYAHKWVPQSICTDASSEHLRSGSRATFNLPQPNTSATDSLNFAEERRKKRAVKLSREQKALKREGAGNIVMDESSVFNLNDHHNQINLNSLKSQFPAH